MMPDQIEPHHYTLEDVERLRRYLLNVYGIRAALDVDPDNNWMLRFSCHQHTVEYHMDDRLWIATPHDDTQATLCGYNLSKLMGWIESTERH